MPLLLLVEAVGLLGQPAVVIAAVWFAIIEDWSYAQTAWKAVIVALCTWLLVEFLAALCYIASGRPSREI